MRIAILCPGPSLCRTYPGPDDYGLVIGVNRTATKFRVDVFAALDAPFIREHHAKLIGKPTLLTKRETWDSVGHRCGLKLATTSDAMLAFLPVASGKAWTLYTATTAIVYAALMGATRIDVYGADMEGTAGFDAEDAGENRSEARWALERAAFGGVAEWLRGRGVTVNQVRGVSRSGISDVEKST